MIDEEVGTKESVCAKGISLGQCKIGIKVSENDLTRKSSPFDSQLTLMEIMVGQ